MKLFKFLFVFLIIPGCQHEDIFSPDVRYIYSPSWKIWEIKYIDPGGRPGNNFTRIRDIETRYIFSDSIVYKSHDRGKNYLPFHTNHLSLDSISFTSLDSLLSESESYFVRDLFITSDARPPADSLRETRDEMFPEIRGKFLFLRLENKQKVRIENKDLSEFLLLYN